MTHLHARDAAFYDAHWTAYGDFITFNPGARNRRRLTLNVLRRLGRLGSLADFGAGSGDLLTAVRATGLPVERYVGLDFSPRSISLLKLRAPFAEGRLFDLERDEPTETFDTVLCCEVLEHLDDPQDATRRLAAATSPSGVLVITVPTGPVRQTQIEIGHVAHPTTSSLASWLRAAGMEPRLEACWGWPGYRMLHAAANLRPESAVSNFGATEYGRGQKIASTAAYHLTRWSSLKTSRFGVQVVMSAKHCR